MYCTTERTVSKNTMKLLTTAMIPVGSSMEISRTVTCSMIVPVIHSSAFSRITSHRLLS